ncbi:MAG: endonuclease III [Candidatus Omnitrophica bacterium CG11_big_fil_rev_8_21_14_0_20_45_26]|uniref:Endonuclease III n=1 Tax=Candidatus Abzuiibacterium crystallinum TaxID=1974748 RepID=A0A2H0LRJ7_9BACT|nr:MAG: endonuclease III [Candidatus Omnitrophica bacterium CG11_big_fil_rev_8_21_14_0_20_45_26]PIW65742.1 MAG: endonuclease III [Candidatus Omnitrophica bacterium CG12_big_fil_rev_8_21_14_0_65_45_16]
MKQIPINRVLAHLKKAAQQWVTPSVTFISVQTKDPFKILMSTLLSLRTKDATTIQASERLFRLAETPKAMLKLSRKQIEQTIFPVGFYRTKAKRILEICQTLLNEYKGQVPDQLDELLKLKGVGRKTANLVLTLGFQKHGICVDTHVHRISNRWGLVKTKTPEQTEFALMKALPKRHWIAYNDLLVSFGQNICQPISPWCSRCPIEKNCPRIGIKRNR